MANTDVIEQLIHAVEAGGAALLDEHKAEIETAAHNASDEAANRIIGTVTNQIKANGLASVVLTPLKNAIIASEPELDKMINDEEDTLITTIETALKHAAGETAPPASH